MFENEKISFSELDKIWILSVVYSKYISMISWAGKRIKSLDKKLFICFNQKATKKITMQNSIEIQKKKKRSNQKEEKNKFHLEVLKGINP